MQSLVLLLHANMLRYGSLDLYIICVTLISQPSHLVIFDLIVSVLIFLVAPILSTGLLNFVFFESLFAVFV